MNDNFLVMGHKWIKNDELNCPFCFVNQDKDIIEFIWANCSNTSEVNIICSDCKRTLRLKQTKNGHLILRKYEKHYKKKDEK